MYARVAPVRSIVSDFDRRTYRYPVVDGRISFTYAEMRAEDERVLALPATHHGLRGLYLPPKLESQLAYGHTYRGFDWISDPFVYSERRERGDFGTRHLTLVSHERTWNSHSLIPYSGDIIFFRFSVHPESGEFLGGNSGTGQHAAAISWYGSYPFVEYVRFVYTGRTRSGALTHGVLLSRAYYNPAFGPEYNGEIDKQKTLRVLALLRLNGLPDDTRLYLSTSRDSFRSFGID